MTRPVIAYVAHRLDPGGTERLVVDMALAMRDEFDTAVFTLDGPGEWASVLAEAGVPVRSLERRPGIDLRVVARLARGLREVRADVIHAHQCSPWFYAALSRRLHSRPRLLLQEHGRFWPEPDRLARRIVNRVVVNPSTHRFVAVSRDIAERIARYEGVPRSRIEVVHNGIEAGGGMDADLRRARRASWGVQDGEVLVGTVGRLDSIKNIPLLIQGIRPLVACGARIKVVIVGDGPERDPLHALVDDAGLSGCVIFTGYRDDARVLAGCFDVFVLPSVSEGISVALLEAMEAGVAPVVTAVGGNTEVVEDGVSGWCVPSGDVEALTRTLDEVISSPLLRVQRGSAALARVRQRFSRTKMLEAYGRIYRELLAAVPQQSTAPTSGRST